MLSQNLKRSFGILQPQFLSSYKSTPVEFGFNGLGEIAYQRSYSRIKESGEKEQWADTVERVVNGCFEMQQRLVPEFD